MQRIYVSSLFTLFLVILQGINPGMVKAQITSDGTTATEVTTEGSNTTIEQGDRIGDNLFHSFEQFSVPTGGSADFNNAADIANIFSRVTGGNVSNIDGLLRANGAANLFLVNPNGIIFGENARLDIGGSFFATSADSLQFEGDSEFSASDPQAPPLLEVDIPIGLNFRDNPGDIAVNGSSLEVPNGENLSLIGGDVDLIGVIDNFILAIEGRVQLGSLAEAGTIEIVSNEAGLASSSLNFPEAVARGDVSLSNGTVISVAGRNGGSIAIDARNITLDNGEIGPSQLDAGIVESGVENAEAGDVILNATDNVDILRGSSILNQVLQGTNGNGGNIEINANSLNITGDFNLGASIVSTALSGTGNTGKVILNISDRTSLASFANVSSNLTEFGVGDTGGVEINSGSLEISDRSLIASQNAGQGNAGDVVIDTGDFTIDGRNEINTEVFDIGIGDGADINISADDITFSVNDSIIADTAGQGNAGNVEINASNSVTFEDGAEIRSQTLETAVGNGGNITLNVPKIDMGSGVNINTTTSGDGDAGNIEINSTNINLTVNATLFSESLSQGRSGSIKINTDTLSLESKPERTLPRISTVAFREGDANDINIQATESITLDGGIIDAQAANFSEFNILDGIGSNNIIRGTGDGGNITISTGTLSLTNGSEITTSTFSTGNAGDIAIEATGSIFLSSSGILSGVGNLGSGNAGAIDLKTPSLAVNDRAEITARTEGDGNASNIAINSDKVSIRKGLITSVTTASSIGDGGDVRVNTQTLDLDNEGQINTSNFGQGNGGDVFVVADAVSLNNGQISAANEPVVVEGNELTGGEVNLEIADIVTLSNDGLISARAGNNASGGNVNLDTDVILAFPDGDNDIVANAAAGRGGNIDINTEALFGIEERAIAPFTNDINASSEFGLDGGIAINTPNVDPTSGLIELPQAVADASDRVSQNPCEQGVGSEFTVTGKGGLPPNPTDSLDGSGVEVGLVEPREETGGREDKETGEQENNIVTEARPAMGWILNNKGEVILTAYSNTNTERERSPQDRTSCQSNVSLKFSR